MTKKVAQRKRKWAKMPKSGQKQLKIKNGQKWAKNDRNGPKLTENDQKWLKNKKANSGKKWDNDQRWPKATKKTVKHTKMAENVEQCPIICPHRLASLRVLGCGLSRPQCHAMPRRVGTAAFQWLCYWTILDHSITLYPSPELQSELSIITTIFLFIS